MKNMHSPGSGAGARALRIYRPDSRFGTGLFGGIAALTREAFDYRSHISTIFRNDFEASYRGTALGVLWNFVLPILPITVYVLLVNLRVFPAREGIPASVYIGFNVILWFLFTGLINQPMQAVRSRNVEAMKTAMPLSATIASSFARLSFDTLVRSAFVIALIVATGASAKLSAIALAPIVIAGAMFFLGLGLLLSILNAAYPDIDRFVTIVLQYGIFLSGVIFPLSSIGPIAFLEIINPFAVFIHAARAVVFEGPLPHPVAFWSWTAAGAALLVASARFFYVMEYRVRGLS